MKYFCDCDPVEIFGKLGAWYQSRTQGPCWYQESCKNGQVVRVHIGVTVETDHGRLVVMKLCAYGDVCLIQPGRHYIQYI